MATKPDADLDEEIETPETEEEQQAPGEDDESEVTLEGEEPAQSGGEGESSVIRDMRASLREKDRLIREQAAKLEASSRPNAPADPGPKPTLADHDFLDEKYEEALDDWYAKKAAFDQANRQATEQAQQIERARLDGYTAAKSAVKIAGIDDAEQRVFAQVDDMTRNALLHAKSPAVIAALDRYPDKLAALSDLAKSDPAGMLIMLGELKAKAQIMPRRKTAEPEQVLNGSASIASASSDKQLEKLEKEAERTRDRTKLVAYKKQLKAAGKAV